MTSMRKSVAALATALTLVAAFAAPRAYAHASHADLHFSHPIVAESPTPDRKVRLDYRFDSFEAGGELHTPNLEAEYAFLRWVSLEVDVPWSYLHRTGRPTENHLNDVEVTLKFATFALADRGLLLGGGVGAELPTGDVQTGIGDEDITVITPYASVGYERGAVELVGFAHFGIPTGGSEADRADLEFTWNSSALVHVTDRLMALAEFDGVHVSGGPEDGFDAVYASPGVKVAPLRDVQLEVGAAVRVALTDQRDTDISTIGSVFYHF